jgi:hypothetical protein
LVIRGRRRIREINRSFYHAHVYEFPVTVGRLHGGTDVLIHCPDGYNRLCHYRRRGYALAEHSGDTS